MLKKLAIKRIVRKSKKIYSLLSNPTSAATSILDKYMNKKFTKFEILAKGIDYDSFYKYCRVDIYRCILEITPKLNLVNSLVETGQISSKVAFYILNSLIIDDVDFDQKERAIIPLLLRMQKQGEINFADYDYSPLKTDVFNNVETMAVIVVLGFKRKIRECLKQYEINKKFCDDVRIDAYEVIKDFYSNGGYYLYPCKSAKEVVNILEILTRSSVIVFMITNPKYYDKKKLNHK